MAVKWFQMDETELICVGVIRKIHEHYMVIDFLPAPPNMDLRSTASKESLSSGDATAWRFTLAKEINETVTLFNDMQVPTKHMIFK
jgi:hypothetical protein